MRESSVCWEGKRSKSGCCPKTQERRKSSARRSKMIQSNCVNAYNPWTHDIFRKTRLGLSYASSKRKPRYEDPLVASSDLRKLRGCRRAGKSIVQVDSNQHAGSDVDKVEEAMQEHREPASSALGWVLPNVEYVIALTHRCFICSCPRRLD